jgi:hypothetical protein
LGIAKVSYKDINYTWDNDKRRLVAEDTAKGNDRAEIREVCAVLQLAFLELQPFLIVEHLAHLYGRVKRAETLEN